MIDVARTTGLGLAIALALRVVVFQPFTIPSSSMEPGLVTGDYIVVSQAGLRLEPRVVPSESAAVRGRAIGARMAQRGDVVVFRLPRDPAQTWIKRVIGLPGDRVQVRGGQVFVNGRALPQARPRRHPGHHDASGPAGCRRSANGSGRPRLHHL